MHQTYIFTYLTEFSGKDTPPTSLVTFGASPPIATDEVKPLFEFELSKISQEVLEDLPWYTNLLKPSPFLIVANIFFPFRWFRINSNDNGIRDQLQNSKIC